MGGLPAGFIINSTVYTTKIASFQCPSDNQIDLLLDGDIPASFSSHQGKLRQSTGETWITARPFSVVSSRPPPALVAVSVRLQPELEPAPSTAESPRSLTGRAIRTSCPSSCRERPTTSAATIWVDNAGAGSYMTRFTPNGYTDYVGLIAPWSTLIGAACPSNNFDNIASFGGSSPGTSPANPGSLCDSQPGQQLGCYDQGNEGSEFAGSRSRHPGGVNSLFGDGSVHFMKNTINPYTWVSSGRSTAARSSAPTSIDRVERSIERHQRVGKRDTAAGRD